MIFVSPLYTVWTVHGMQTGYRAAPVREILKFIPIIHKHQNQKSYVERSRLNQQKKSFLKVGASLWNEIPEDVRNLPKTFLNS